MAEMTDQDQERSPQCEDGYVRIANELFDALIDVRMPGDVRRVFDYILRMTYGYNRKTFKTTHRDIANRLKSKRQRVSEALAWLSAANMIISTKNRADLAHDCLTTLAIQKRYALWKSARKTVPENTGTENRAVSARKTVPICMLKTILKTKESSTRCVMEGECEGEPTAVPAVAVTAPPATKPEKRKRQLPPDFALTEELAAYARSQGLNGDIPQVFAHFTDYHRAKGSTMLDWNAAWRTWVRNENKFTKPSRETEVERWKRRHGLIP